MESLVWNMNQFVKREEVILPYGLYRTQAFSAANFNKTKKNPRVIIFDPWIRLYKLSIPTL